VKKSGMPEQESPIPWSDSTRLTTALASGRLHKTGIASPNAEHMTKVARTGHIVMLANGVVRDVQHFPEVEVLGGDTHASNSMLPGTIEALPSIAHLRDRRTFRMCWVTIEAALRLGESPLSIEELHKKFRTVPCLGPATTPRPSQWRKS
jgi:hypothetical protein